MIPPGSRNSARHAIAAVVGVMGVALILAAAGSYARPGEAPGSGRGIEASRAARLIARERYLDARRGLDFGVPAGAYGAAFAAMRSAGTRAARSPAREAASSGSAIPPAWQFIGPQPIVGEYPTFGGAVTGPVLANTTGRVTSIAADSAVAGRIYAGTADGGIWLRPAAESAFAPIFDAEPTLTIGAIAIDAGTSPNPTVYVATGEGDGSADSYYGAGIFTSTDAGASWTQLGSIQFASVSIGSVALDTRNEPPTIYAAASFGSSASRADASWIETGFGAMGVWRSSDGGQSWSHYPLGTFGTCPYFSNDPCPATQVVVDPANPSIVFASIMWTGVFRSSDSGATWAQASFPGLAGSVGRSSITISGSNAYAIVGAFDGAEYLGFYASTDGGLTWSARTVPRAALAGGVTIDGTSAANATASFFDQALAIDPADASGKTVIFGGVGIYRSSDGGQTWTFLANSGGTSAGQHAITFDPSSAHSFYVGNEGGLYRFDAPSQQWAALNSQIAVAGVQSVAPSPVDDAVALAGFGANGTARADASASPALAWQQVDGQDGGMVAFDPSNPSLAYHTFATTAAGPAISSSTDGGKTWMAAAPTSALRSAMAAAGDAGAGYFPPLAVDPAVAGRVMFGAHSVYVTSDAMNTWSRQTTQDLTGGCGDGTCALEDLEIAPSDDTRAYALAMETNSTARRTPFRLMTTAQADVHVDAAHPAGAAWADVTANLSPYVVPDDTQATCVAIDPFDYRVAYLGLSGFTAATGVGHVMATRDFGQTWTEADGGSPDTYPPPAGALPDIPVLRLLVDRNDPSGNTVLAATDIGIFRTSDGGADWAPFDLGVIPAVPVFDLEQNPGGAIFAGTFGRGVYEMAAASSSATPSPTPTATSTSTATPTGTASSTPTATATRTATATPTASATATATASRTPTPTPTPTPQQVPAALVVQPRHRNFGSLVFGVRGATSKPRLIELRNRGSSAMALMATEVAGDYAIDAGSTTCKVALGAHQQCAYAIVFTPAALGLRRGTFTITDNAANNPQTITLAGKGVPGAIHVAPKRIDFGKVPVAGASAQRTISIVNPNPVPLEVSGVAVNGPGFAIADGCTGELAADATCTIAVTFAPESGAGAKGAVTISDDAAKSPQAVRLSGRGAP